MFGTGPYARFFTILWSVVAALTLLLSLRYGDDRGFPGGEYASLVLFAAAGMALLSAATSLVGFFLGLESFTLALYILIAFDKTGRGGRRSRPQVPGPGCGGDRFHRLRYRPDLHRRRLLPHARGDFGPARAAGAGMRPLALLGWAMLLVAVGFKVSLVPFHLWTPDVYQGAPAPVTGLLSSGSKGAVFAALVTISAGIGRFAELGRWSGCWRRPPCWSAPSAPWSRTTPSGCSPTPR